MLFQRWASVVEPGPLLNQHRFNVCWEGEKLKYIMYSFHHYRRCWQHSVNTCIRCTLYRGCRPTHQIAVQCWASVAAQCWFNADRSCTTLAQHYSNTDPTHDSSTPASTATTGWLTNVCFNVDPTSLTTAQQQPSILYT